MSTLQARHDNTRDLVKIFVFVAITFAITWGIIGSYILWPDAMSARFGAVSGSHPLYFIATWAPAIAGLSVVLISAGFSGLKRFCSRLLMWRCPGVWWLFILLGIPLVFMAGSLIKGGPLFAPIPPEGAGAMFGLMLMMLFLGPIEEFGWRGVAQPLLQRFLVPFWTGALIGTIWGVWHLPAFYLAGVVYENWSFLPFLIGNITLAVLVTPIFNAARGSLLLPMLFHWQLINPFWPDAQPWDSWILTGVAIIIIWWKRDEMFSRDGAMTEMIPGEDRQ
ncbi:CPBP family intramembrane glutamic endopeptidase [Aestuariivita boseongensis]|uniref:CPBP family intramembrane glutamic endopeptidase n=1 Tax=Aestuariivita boseongensis TaxID=1470562 RepID=UPI00068272BF|nr:CPBP family intramembrane glutamic endopeptidase [Aestuariivita boseongensis]